jgi:hypothetical protein
MHALRLIDCFWQPSMLGHHFPALLVTATPYLDNGRRNVGSSGKTPNPLSDYSVSVKQSMRRFSFPGHNSHVADIQYIFEK